MKKNIYIILSIVLFIVVGLLFSTNYFNDIFNKNEINKNLSNKITEEKIINIVKINAESINIVNGINKNKIAKKILSKEVINKFIISNVGDFNIHTETLLEYIEKNNSHIVKLFERINKDIHTIKNTKQIKTRLIISTEINKNLKKLFKIITNYNEEIKKLNKELLVLDFLFKEKISIWIYISKEHGFEDKMSEILTEVLQNEDSLESKLKYLFDGWLDKNTLYKLEIYFKIYSDFDLVKNDFKNIDNLIKAKYPEDYQYSENYIKKIKNKQ